LIGILNDGEQGLYGKKIGDDGTIEEGVIEEMGEELNLIKGWRWRLKEDGSYDKYKVEKVPCKKEKSEENEEEEDEEEDQEEEEDEDEEEEVETFICNEKIY
jgi:hypothetical protein